MLEQNMKYRGYQLTADVKTEKEGLLLKKGIVLTKETVRRLTNFNISIDRYAEHLKQSADIHPYPFYEALKQLRKDSFGKLDAKITHTFINKTMQSAVGSIVQLTNGKVGIIKFIPIEDPIFPLIEVEGEIFNTILSHTHIKQFVADDQHQPIE
ncbi:hypothetical protein [Bacillus sp. FJAT-45037]|uniref:hypothetical protein n=1 Tax=Bacillus sp. FJAT-45037 TaxID=2011007 RepID=UPI000C244CDD|nr:hypothetical protein [Bacillus sp. FJAT-45037]